MNIIKSDIEGRAHLTREVKKANSSLGKSNSRKMGNFQSRN